MPDDRRARLRAADADRELVHEILSAAMAHGSLSPVEYEERAGKAVLAKTFGDLDALTDTISRWHSSASRCLRPACPRARG